MLLSRTALLVPLGQRANRHIVSNASSQNLQISMMPAHVPAPAPTFGGSEEPYRLKALHLTQIRMCYGCGNALRIPPEIPDPPDDVVLAHKEFRAYRNSEGLLKVTFQKKDVHYQKCVKEKHSDFSEDDICVTSDIRCKLSAIHMRHLRREFGLQIE